MNGGILGGIIGGVGAIILILFLTKKGMSDRIKGKWIKILGGIVIVVGVFTMVGKLFAVELPDPKVADGFDYPLRKYFPIKLGFLEKFVRPIGCPLHYHPGEDVFNFPGTEIYSAANGTVIFDEYQNKFSGYLVIIEHVAPPGAKFKLPDGGEIDKVWSAYYHMSKIDESNVALNKVVKKGARIGFMGDFPHGTGKRYHLHFEIRKKNLWNGSAYTYKKNTVCQKPKEWVADKFVCPNKFIRLNRPNINEKHKP